MGRGMAEIEEMGLLKMDFLGLRTLTVIRDAELAVQKKDPRFAIAKLDYDDPETYQMLSRGETEGVFQLESSGMKQVLMGLQPQHLEDVIALISLYRPGPMDSIPTFFTAFKPKRICPLASAVKPPPETLTSGGSTLMPSRAHSPEYSMTLSVLSSTLVSKAAINSLG